MTLNTVVLPAPFGPISPTSSPFRIERSRSQTAFKPPNCMVTFSMLRSGSRGGLVASLIADSSGRSRGLLRSRTTAEALSEPAPEVQLARAHQALRPRDHEHDEHERI